VSTMNRVCEACGESFWQGRGRPAKRCPPCREQGHSGRYGARHRAIKAAGPGYETSCTRCQRPILAGQPAEPDHRDGGGPQDYDGWAHASCNHSAGASRGNRLRAQAYRQLKAAILNGSAPPATPPTDPPPSPRSRRW
jgi:hypothetical protein